MRAISLLAGFKFRNGLRTLFSDPRKLIPFIIFLCILAAFAGLASLGVSDQSLLAVRGSIKADAFGAGVMIALVLLGLGYIDSGLGDGLLAFGLCDVDYLFPSPISRRVILAYRLPGLMFSNLFMTGFALFAFSFATQIARPLVSHPGHSTSPGWVAPAALFLSGGIYMNLAMFISITVPNRRAYHKLLAVLTIGLCAGIGVLAWLKGMDAVNALVQSAWIRIPFYPSSLGTETLLAQYSHRPTAPFLCLLALGYALSLIPMFTSRANWYEQSIVSSERMSTFRSAARGGYATLMAARAANFKHRSDKPYTIPPFGKGAMALFWAHLCAAAKKPLANFITPFAGGIGVGAFGALTTIKNQGTNWDSEMIAYIGLIMVVAYGSLGFMTTAKTASESAIRRRELISPLPMKGWQTVLANLGAPFVSGLLFFVGCSGTYMVFQGPNWPLIGFVVGLGLTLRLAARMALQYIIGVTYPDAADKIQQFFAVGIYGIVSLPFIILEFLVSLPGIALHSIWLGVIAVTSLQIPLTVLFVFLAGKGTDRAIATGEPVTLWSLVRPTR